MKKFLAILLIAVIACAAIEEDNLKGYDDLMKFIKEMEAFVNFVIQKNLNKQLLEAVKKGKQSAVQFCFTYYKKNNCQDIIAGLYTFKDFLDKIQNSL